MLDKFNADLCREMTGMAGAQEILDYLCRVNLFLIPLDSKSKWYRYHHMFSEAIRRQIENFSPELASTADPARG